MKKTEVKPHTFTDDNGNVLILKRLPKNRIARNGFVYPEGIGSVVECKEWNTTTECGGGLHGWPFGFGLGEGSDYDLDDVWLILAAKPEDVVGELEGGWKCKCRKASIAYDGTFSGAINTMRKHFTACVQAMCKIKASSNLAASGASSNLAASGNSSNLAASGASSNLAASGASSNLAASGYSSNLAASGDYSQLAASGYSSNLAASGYYSNLAASGYSSNLAASGYSSKLAASGYSSNLAASGDYSKLAASGNSSKLAASGASSQLAASGDSSKLELTGIDGVALCINSKVKAASGCTFAIAEKIEKGFKIHVAVVGEGGIKADTWYHVAGGKIVEAT